VELPGVIPARPVARPVFWESDAGFVPNIEVLWIKSVLGARGHSLGELPLRIVD
jgi:hypothetical protein